MNQSVSNWAPKEEVQPIESQEAVVKRNVLYTTGCLYELTKWIIVALILITLVHFFVGTLSIVDGVSMEPNFHNGEYLIIDRWHYNFGEPSRGDAVVLKFPGDPEHKKYIKRIIGLPGERIEIREGNVYINGQMLNEAYIPASVQTLADQPINRVMEPEEYFIMGDNRMNSNDSRIWGTADKRFLIGKAWFQIYPQIKKMEAVKY